jgi:hypothetical protein
VSSISLDILCNLWLVLVYRCAAWLLKSLRLSLSWWGKKKTGWDANETKLPASDWLSMDHREFVYKRTNCWCVSLHFQFFAHSVSSALSFDLDCFLWYYCSAPPLSLLPTSIGNHFLCFLGCPRMTHRIVLFKLVSLQIWISKSLSKLNHERMKPQNPQITSDCNPLISQKQSTRCNESTESRYQAQALHLNSVNMKGI